MIKWFGRRTAERPLPGDWQEDVLAASRIAQDDDDALDEDVAERRFDEFIALLDLVRGNEDDEVFRTLLRCLRPQDDYGAYECLLGRLASFPPDRRGRLTAEGLPELIHDNREMAGVVISDLARSGSQARAAFKRSARGLPPDERRDVARFVMQEVGDGWLSADDLGREG